MLAFVNGMGGTPLIELYLVFNELQQLLEGHGITIERNLVGPYITSLEMAGTSITLLRMDDELVRLWDAPVRTAGPAVGRMSEAPGTEQTHDHGGGGRPLGAGVRRRRRPRRRTS